MSHQCRCGTTLGGWFEADDLAVKLVVADDEVRLGDDERVSVFPVDPIEGDLFAGLDVHKHSQPVDVTTAQFCQSNDVTALRACCDGCAGW